MKKFNICLFHYIANFTDGVSLEMNKWKKVLEEMGHTVHTCAGKFGSNEDFLVEEMYHHRPESRLLNFNTFKALKDYKTETIYRSELYRIAGIIEDKIQAIISKNKINLLIPQNVWSVAANPAVSIALTDIMRKNKIPALAHNHDFYFERIDGYSLTCSTAAELVDLYYPPRDKFARHVVINSLAQDQLLQRKGILSTVVPNTFDFEGGAWQSDDYNIDFRQRIGLDENDIFILQATRIVTRKGIELAIDFVKALNSKDRRKKFIERGLYDGRNFSENNRIVLVLAGYSIDDVTGRYKDLLYRKSKDLGIEAIFIEDMVGERRKKSGEHKIYSLWDTYVYSDLITYPSLWEGWGNQLLEAIKAKKPLVLFEYPVYVADIKDKGLKTISLGNEIHGRDERGLVTLNSHVINAAADEAVDLLTFNDLRQDVVENNFKVGKKHFSLDALYIYLEYLLNALTQE